MNKIRKEERAVSRYKKLFNKILFPKLWFILIGIPVAAAGLIFIFLENFQDEWIAYPIYIFSAYILTVVCVLLWQVSRHTKQNINAVMDRAPAVRRYFTDKSFNLNVSLYYSLSLNIIYAVIRFTFGVYSHSIWFGTLAIYYLLLAVTRFALVRYARRNEFGANMLSEWKRYRLCGTILLVVNLALSGVITMMIKNKKSFNYTGILIYIMAVYVFCNITFAIINVIKYRKYRSPVMSAAKVLHLVSAMVSMVALETAMLSQFGVKNDWRFRNIMIGTTGTVVCIIIFGTAIYMIFHSTVRIERIKREKTADI